MYPFLLMDALCQGRKYTRGFSVVTAFRDRGLNHQTQSWVHSIVTHQYLRDLLRKKTDRIVTN